MSDPTDVKGLSRAELLRRGALGMIALSIAPAGCRPKETVRVEAGDSVDPGPVGYREVGKLDVGLQWPRGVTVSKDQILVAGDMHVRRFDRSGGLLEEIGVPGAAKAVAEIDELGLVVALDDRLVAIRDGETREWPSLGPRARITAIAVVGRSVFVADAGNRVVMRYGFDGKTYAEIGRDREGKSTLVVPSPYLGLAGENDGHILVSNPGKHRIERYNRFGRMIASFGEQGQEVDKFCGCCNPTTLAVLANGDVVTAEKGLPRVKVLSPTGELRSVVVPHTELHVKTAGLALATEGERIWVLDPWSGLLKVYEPVKA